MYAAKAAQAAAVSPGGSPGYRATTSVFHFWLQSVHDSFCGCCLLLLFLYSPLVLVVIVVVTLSAEISFIERIFCSGPMMSPSSQWGGSSYSGEGPYGGF